MRFIKLTSFYNTTLPIHLQPELISSMCRMGSYEEAGFTEVTLSTGQTFHVRETPEAIAKALEAAILVPGAAAGASPLPEIKP